MKRVLVGIATAAVVAITAVAAFANGGSSAATPVAATSPAPSQGARPHKGFVLLHADGVAMKRDGSTVDARVQKGIIRNVDSTSITLRSPDGYEQTYVIDGSTKVREKRRPADVSELKQGEMARVVALKGSDGTYTARVINCVGEPGPRLRGAASGA